MKYIIMCGGSYPSVIPKQLFEINNEPIVARTIRLLRECGISNISISSNDDRFNVFGVPVIHHTNSFVYGENRSWLDAFYPTGGPVCYIYGDVVFSKKAISTIVNTDTDDIQFFASTPPFSPKYIKIWAEPFAYKVVNQNKFRECIQYTRELDAHGFFAREPVSWELWQVIKGTPLNIVDYTNYVPINDYTCDVDDEEDLKKIRGFVD